MRGAERYTNASALTRTHRGTIFSLSHWRGNNVLVFQPRATRNETDELIGDPLPIPRGIQYFPIKFFPSVVPRRNKKLQRNHRREQRARRGKAAETPRKRTEPPAAAGSGVQTIPGTEYSDCA